MTMFRFGHLGNIIKFFSSTNEKKSSAIIKIVDDNGIPLSDISVELKYNDKVVSGGVTNKNGIIKIRGYPHYSYTLIISGKGIETTNIENYRLVDSEISVLLKRYLELNPKYIWLNPENLFREDVNVISNDDWTLS